MKKLLIAVTTALTMSAANAEEPDAAAGEALYADSCAQCHGPEGKGMASFPSVAGRDSDYIASRLEQYRDGEKVGSNSGLMIPNAADLSDEDIANLATYISSEFQ
ncbi:c-type cytochrome [Aidingimonas halophila]|uniref:Cytochrome c553 n=1 Tax=Aidingimonas halophila TaxID=574349 RepID=A0A1H2TY92_9GAMM|nr:c-type cytochrome [Aidingimonas halophila]GHC38603.1 cytochrome c biogenesis protein CcsB [Aidingimonas halophila]SDW48249.1 Cytochrome c553 [Aidingimonas halophila]